MSVRTLAPAMLAALSSAACSNTVLVASQSAIHADVSTLDFGAVTGGTSVSKTLTLSNQGTTSLTLTGVAISNDPRHAFSLGATPQLLTAGGSALVQVTYAAPMQAGADAATLTVISSADNTPMLAISLTGRSSAGCVPETNTAFCVRLGKNCGPVSAADNCGAQRAVQSCGACTLPAACGALGVAGVCDVPLRTLTVAASGSGGGSVTSSGGLACTASNGSVSGTCSLSVPQGTTVQLASAPDANSRFGGFSGACAGSACAVTLGAADANVSAAFLAVFPVNVTVVGSGSVSSTPAGIGCGATCSATFDAGTPVSLTATAASGFAFTGFSGDCLGTSCGFNIAATKNVTATFATASAPHLVTARAQHQAVLLPSGKVLVVGGVGAGQTPLKDAELYDPASGTFSPAGSATHTLWFSSATLLADGRVLIAGGFDGSYSNFSADTWFWTEANGFVPGPALPAGRGFHSAVRLQSGKVLVVSGIVNNALCQYPTDSQLFDPAGNGGAGGWTASGSLHADRSNAGVALLTSGKVLLAGGPQDNCPTPNLGQSEAELYDPSTGAWTVTGSMVAPRSTLDLVALGNGDALVAAGTNNSGVLGSAETFHVGSSGAFSPTGALTTARTNDAAVLLSDGTVAVTGGTNGTSTTTYLTSVEIYDPVARTWAAGSTQLSTARTSHTATLLQSGKILAVGGFGASGAPLDSFEVLGESAGFAIGGTVSGLSGSGLVLGDSLNGGAIEQLSVTSNGTFVFPTRATSGQTYAVSVLTHPSGPAQTCTVTAGSGTATAAVTGIQVSCPPAVIATPPASPQLIVANASNLYFTTNTEIYSLPTAGGALTPFAVIQGGNGDSGAYGLALDSSYLYFTDYGLGALKKVLLSSGALTTMTTFGYSSYYAQAVAVAGGNVYWGGYTSGQVEETPAGGSSITQLFNAGSTYNSIRLTTDASNIYWSSSPNTGYNAPNHGGIYQLPLTATSGAGAVTLASGLAGPNSIATTSGYVYWADATDGNVKAVPIGGTAMTVVAPAETSPGGIVADASAIYWVDTLSSTAPYSSSIRTCTVAAGACGPITTVATVADVVTSLALNDRSLFWVGYYTNRIWQTVK